MDKIRVIYISPNCEVDYKELQSMTNEKRSEVEGAQTMTLEEFQVAFNWGDISDLGYIFFVE
jgi:hypothetical protein